MADAKTIQTGASVANFLAAVEPDSKRGEAETLDALFRRVTGEAPKLWGPSIIGYGEYRTTYASGRDVHWMRTGFSPRKGKHSLYLMGGYCDELARKEHEDLLARLGKYKTGKSCLYINKLADVDMDVLEELLRTDWATMQRIYPPE